MDIEVVAQFVERIRSLGAVRIKVEGVEVEFSEALQPSPYTERTNIPDLSPQDVALEALKRIVEETV